MTIGRRSGGRWGAIVWAVVLLRQTRGGENVLVARAFRQARGRGDGRAELTSVRAMQGNMGRLSSQLAVGWPSPSAILLRRSVDDA